MAIELRIDGYVSLEVSHKESGKEVTKEEESEVIDKLQRGELLFGMDSKTITNYENEVLYTCSIDPTDSLEYEFDEE